MTTKALLAFSLDFYDWEGVAAACITLQNDHGIDVDIAVALWRQLVVRLVRQVRCALKLVYSHLFDPGAAMALRDTLACYAGHAGIPREAAAFAPLVQAFA